MKLETEADFVGAARAMSATFLDRFAKEGLSPGDVTTLCGAFAAEIMAQQIGPIGAVEMLRNIADTLERQVFADAGLR